MQLGNTKKILCTTMFVLLLSVFCQPLRGDEERDEKVVAVEFFLFIEENNDIQRVMRRDANNMDYKLEKLKDGHWEDVNRSDWYVRMGEHHVESGRKLNAKAHLSVGHYRIYYDESILFPIRCYKEFEISNREIESKKVKVPHERLQLIAGQIAIVDEQTGNPFPGVTVRYVPTKTYSHIGIWEDEWIRRRNRIVTNEEGLAELWFLPDQDKLEFNIRDYRFTGDWSKQTRVFSSNDLQEGAVWKISEAPVRAKIKVYLQKEDGGIILFDPQDKTVRELFEEDIMFERMRYWQLPVFEPDMAKQWRFNRRHSRDRGNFVPEDKAFVYRNLDFNKDYIISPFLLVVGNRNKEFPLVEGAKMGFRIEEGEVFETDVVVAPWIEEVKPEKLDFSGQIEYEDGLPIRGASIELRGPGFYETLEADGEGEFSVALEPGIYQVQIKSSRTRPWSESIDLSDGEDRHLEVIREMLPVVEVRVTLEEDMEFETGWLRFYHSEEESYQRAGTPGGPIYPDDVREVVVGKQGKYTVLFHELGKMRFSPTPMLSGRETVYVGDDLEAKVDLPVRPGQVIGVNFQEETIPDSEDALKLIIWEKVEEIEVPVGFGKWRRGKPELSNLYVPRYGEYSVQIFLTKEGPEGKIAQSLGLWYWHRDLIIDSHTEEIELTIDENTKQTKTDFF